VQTLIRGSVQTLSGESVQTLSGESDQRGWAGGLTRALAQVVYGPHFEETVHGLDDIGLPGALFLSMGGAAADHLFRNDGCMRLGADRGTCLAKDQLYYPTVTDGLDVLISEFSERGRLLAKDSALDLHLLNERFKFLWQVSEHDAAGGLATHTQLYVDQVLAGGKLELLLASMMLAVFIGGSIGYYNFMIKPFVKKTEMQQHRVAQVRYNRYNHLAPANASSR